MKKRIRIAKRPPRYGRQIDICNKLLQRVVRIETRLCRLASALKVNVL